MATLTHSTYRVDGSFPLIVGQEPAVIIATHYMPNGDMPSYHYETRAFIVTAGIPDNADCSNL